MSYDNSLSLVADLLKTAQIPYMVVGSVGSGTYGQPRTTNDVDIVIDPSTEQLERWIALLSGDYYVSADAAHDALRRRSMFNIINLKSGLKTDLIVRKNRPFSIEEFSRKRENQLQDRSLMVASAEDIILSKLEWNSITPSERQLQDALNVASAQWTKLDQAYLRKWAPDLGIAEALEELLRAAEQAQPPANS